jgi:hypothetical protein
MGKTNLVDLKTIPDEVTKAVNMLARNTVHLARWLDQSGYPPD